MKVSVQEVNKRNTRNAALSAYKELYTFCVEGQDESLEKWKKYTKDLSASEKLFQKRQFQEALNNPHYTEMVRPLLDPRGRVIRWHASFVIALMRGDESCEVDVLGGLKVDLSVSDTDTQTDAIDQSQSESDLSESDEVSE